MADQPRASRMPIAAEARHREPTAPCRTGDRSGAPPPLLASDLDDAHHPFREHDQDGATKGGNGREGELVGDMLGGGGGGDAVEGSDGSDLVKFRREKLATRYSSSPVHLP